MAATCGLNRNPTLHPTLQYITLHHTTPQGRYTDQAGLGEMASHLDGHRHHVAARRRLRRRLPHTVHFVGQRPLLWLFDPSVVDACRQRQHTAPFARGRFSQTVVSS